MVRIKLIDNKRFFTSIVPKVDDGKPTFSAYVYDMKKDVVVAEKVISQATLAGCSIEETELVSNYLIGKVAEHLKGEESGLQNN